MFLLVNKIIDYNQIAFKKMLYNESIGNIILTGESEDTMRKKVDQICKIRMGNVHSSKYMHAIETVTNVFIDNNNNNNNNKYKTIEEINNLSKNDAIIEIDTYSGILTDQFKKIYDNIFKKRSKELDLGRSIIKKV
jgi:hypothetical protein